MPTKRSDKKFPIKLWLSETRKKVFRSSCMEYHLSMMFVGEQFLIAALRDFNDTKLHYIIKERLENKFHKLTETEDNNKVLGIRLTNQWWQKLGYFAVYYETSVAKIATCIFDYAYDCYELQTVYKEYGTHVPRKRKKGIDRQNFEERLSDY